MLLLAGCGGKKGSTHSGGGQLSAPGAATSRSPAPRSRPLPAGKPYDFETPFSAGQFVRQAMRGRATATQTGGLQTTYQQGGTVVVVTAYYFDTPEEAGATVRFALASATLTQIVEGPFDSRAVVYGIAQDRNGGYVAAWSHNGWCFLARTTGSLEALQEFLGAFPY